MSHILGISAVAVGLVSYVPYLWGMYQGKVRPHAFTWFLWGLLTAVAFAAQLSDGAGPGSWITGVTAVVSLGVAAAALHQSRFSNVAHVDWYFFIAALLSIPLWLITDTPLYSVLLVTLIDVWLFSQHFANPGEGPSKNPSSRSSLARSSSCWGSPHCRSNPS